MGEYQVKMRAKYVEGSVTVIPPLKIKMRSYT